MIYAETPRRVVYRTHVSKGRVSDLLFRPTKTIMFGYFWIASSESVNVFFEILGAHCLLKFSQTTAAAIFFTLCSSRK